MGVQAAIYARKSTEQTGVADEQKSVTRQIDHARAYATRKGWTVADEHLYVDDGISGAEFTNRPGFLRLMNALKPAPFTALIMSEVSRLGREQIETAYALKQLSVAGVHCFSYLEDRELLMESATDKFLLGAVTFAADLEREKGRQRTYDAMLRKARAGHVTGGLCFGYRNVEILGADGKRSHVERAIASRSRRSRHSGGRLALRRKRPWRHATAVHREQRRPATDRNDIWSMDFVSDELADGRRFRTLTIIDLFTRECVAIDAGQGLGGQDVAASLERLRFERGLPQRIYCDNGTEFVSAAMDLWAYTNQVILDFSRRGKPTDNATIESFNGRFREECLNVHWFASLEDAQEKIDAFRWDYNENHPHRALKGLSPNEHARRAMTTAADSLS